MKEYLLTPFRTYSLENKYDFDYDAPWPDTLKIVQVKMESEEQMMRAWYDASRLSQLTSFRLFYHMKLSKRIVKMNVHMVLHQPMEFRHLQSIALSWLTLISTVTCPRMKDMTLSLCKFEMNRMLVPWEQLERLSITWCKFDEATLLRRLPHMKNLRRFTISPKREDEFDWDRLALALPDSIVTMNFAYFAVDDVWLNKLSCLKVLTSFTCMAITDSALSILNSLNRKIRLSTRQLINGSIYPNIQVIEYPMPPQ